MGRSKQITKRQPKKKSWRKRRSASSSSKPSLGKLVAKGVRSLVASIPAVGPTLASIADIAFKGFGLTYSVPKGDSVDAQEVTGTGLVSRFHIEAATVLSGSRSVIQRDMGRSVMCQYCDGRLMDVTVKVIPTNEVSKRQGYWTLAIQPFFSDKDVSNPGFSGNWNPTDQGMKHMYLSITGPASKPLSLTYRPKVTDGYAFQFHSLDTPVAEVAIKYMDPCRSAYSDFTPDQFSCQIIISGSIDLRTSPSMPATDAGGYVFDTVVKDKLKDVGCYLYDVNNKVEYAISATGFLCVSTPNSCKVTGKILRPRSFSDDFVHLDRLSMH